jgi:hypothetical protein
MVTAGKTLIVMDELTPDKSSAMRTGGLGIVNVPVRDFPVHASGVAPLVGPMAAFGI